MKTKLLLLGLSVFFISCGTYKPCGATNAPRNKKKKVHKHQHNPRTNKKGVRDWFD